MLHELGERVSKADNEGSDVHITKPDQPRVRPSSHECAGLHTRRRTLQCVQQSGEALAG